MGRDRSGDNLNVYDDGGSHCFSCGYHRHGEGVSDSEELEDGDSGISGSLRAGESGSIPDRKISEAACRKFGVTLGGSGEHIYPYYRDGQLVAQKVRIPETKEFFLIYADKSNKTLELFGQHLWKASKSGKAKLVITEGELDCLSVSQLQDNKWPVVSVPNGAQGAAESIRQNLEFVSQFDEIVLCFDMDEPGRKAAQKCAELLPVGKAYIVELPLKDANEMLMKGRGPDVINCIWQARPFRPDGIVSATDVKLEKNIKLAGDWPWDSLTKTLLGRRAGELVTITSGSGMGKSTFIREVIYNDICNDEKVGVLMLEESVEDTLQDIIGLHLEKPVRRILVARAINKARAEIGKEPLNFGVTDNLSQSELDRAHKVIGKNLFLYDHFGSLECDTLISKIRYMVQGLGCTKVYLDHITLVVSGLDTKDERKDIDILMTKLKSLTQETGVHLVAVSQLRKSDGVPYEEGGRVTAQDLRGSGSIHHLSNVLLALERNQQSEDSTGKNRVCVRCLKDRLGGYAGVVGNLEYDPATGRLNESESSGEAAFGNASGSAPSSLEIMEMFD